MKLFQSTKCGFTVLVLCLWSRLAPFQRQNSHMWPMTTTLAGEGHVFNLAYVALMFCLI